MFDHGGQRAERPADELRRENRGALIVAECAEIGDWIPADHTLYLRDVGAEPDSSGEIAPGRLAEQHDLGRIDPVLVGVGTQEPNGVCSVFDGGRKQCLTAEAVVVRPA